MREIRSSGSAEGVVSNHDPYSDSAPSPRKMRRTVSKLGVSIFRSIRLRWLRSTWADRESWTSVLPWRSRIERMAEPKGNDN
jgi:hypothetical protein